MFGIVHLHLPPLWSPTQRETSHAAQTTTHAIGWHVHLAEIPRSACGTIT